MTPAFFLGFQTCYISNLRLLRLLRSWEKTLRGLLMYLQCCKKIHLRKEEQMLPHQKRRETSLQKPIQVWINDPSGQHATRTLTPNIVTPLWPPWLLYHANPSRFPGHQSTAPKMQPFANANGFPTNVLCNLHRRGPSLWHRAQEESCCAKWCFKCRSKKCFIDPYWGFDWLCSIPKLGCTDVPSKKLKVEDIGIHQSWKPVFQASFPSKTQENNDSKPLGHLTILPSHSCPPSILPVACPGLLGSALASRSARAWACSDRVSTPSQGSKR